ncbi:aminoglycoside phosphotransferase family protein [Actinomycetospora sp. C-140]
MTSTPAGRRAARSRDARNAALTVARGFGLPVDDPAELGDQFSVVLHLRPAPVVVRVPTWTAEVRDPGPHVASDLAVGTWLHEQGVPVAPPSAEVPPGPHEQDGHHLSFWAWVRPDPAAEPVTPTVQAGMLRELHEVFAAYPGPLPGLEPVATDIEHGLAALDRHPGVLSADEEALLRDAAAELLPEARVPSVPAQPLHGDVHANNLVVGAHGPVWIDFEEACHGPLGWDLGMFGWDAEGRAAAAAGYGDVPAFRTFSRLRALHLAAFLLGLRDHFADTEGWDPAIHWFLSHL